jgi:hypothetical protein
MKRSKLEKNKEAEERAKERARISNKDQLAVLDSRLGKDVGATKERARLKILIENAQQESKKKRKTKESEETN